MSKGQGHTGRDSGVLAWWEQRQRGEGAAWGGGASRGPCDPSFQAMSLSHVVIKQVVLNVQGVLAECPADGAPAPTGPSFLPRAPCPQAPSPVALPAGGRMRWGPCLEKPVEGGGGPCPNSQARSALPPRGPCRAEPSVEPRLLPASPPRVPPHCSSPGASGAHFPSNCPQVPSL